MDEKGSEHVCSVHTKAGTLKVDFAIYVCCLCYCYYFTFVAWFACFSFVCLFVCLFVNKVT